MSEHEHIHDESCGCHGHEHEHHHHEHEHHHHDHGADCDCGCHDHDHEHHHHDHVHGRDVDGIHIEHHIQDEACVVSGVMQLEGDYDVFRPRVSAQLEAVAAAITAQGGIVGHVKAAAEVTNTEMFSVTDVKAMAKTAPTQTVTVKMAAIVFAVEPEAVEALVEQALRAIRG